MGISQILTPDQVSLASAAEGVVRTKPAAIRRLSVLLAHGQSAVAADEIERVLSEREALQSTGVGGGVAIPHGAIEKLDHLVGAVLLCPTPIEFDAIDGQAVDVVLVLLLPAAIESEALGALALAARTLRSPDTRARLRAAKSPTELYSALA